MTECVLNMTSFVNNMNRVVLEFVLNMTKYYWICPKYHWIRTTYEWIGQIQLQESVTHFLCNCIQFTTLFVGQPRLHSVS